MSDDATFANREPGEPLTLDAVTTALAQFKAERGPPIAGLLVAQDVHAALLKRSDKSRGDDETRGLIDAAPPGAIPVVVVPHAPPGFWRALTPDEWKALKFPLEVGGSVRAQRVMHEIEVARSVRR